MHHGRTKGSLYSRRKMLDAVSSLNADILCVQEIDFRSMRTFFSDQPKQIAQECGYNFCKAKVRFHGAGFQNIAIFSKFPILSSRDLLLPSKSQQQRRKSLSAHIDCGSVSVEVSTMHLHSHGSHAVPNDTAVSQFEFAVESMPIDTISLIGADLNMEKEVPPLAEKFGFICPSGFPTSPANNPRRQIDWILARGCSVNETKTSEYLIGDHRALISSVTLP